jgi:hypothetical protein
VSPGNIDGEKGGKVERALVIMRTAREGRDSLAGG